MNIKKLFAVLAGVSFTAQTLLPVGVMGATYSQELQGAYDWAYAKGVTTQSPIDNANMYGAITRAEMAKMLSVYAEKVLGLTADEAASCNFTDIDSVKGDLHDYIIKSCKLGIMGQKISAFRPYDTLSRAEFGTALSRVLWGNKYEGGTPYYANHLNALKAAGIMNQIANAEQTKEVRGYVMLMLQRSEASEGGVDCDDPVTTLACLDPELDAYKDCPAACREDASDEDKDSDEVVKSGDLEVSAQAAADRKILINGTSDLDTLTFKSSEEVTLNKVILERYGYSANNDVAQIWLENENGTVISNVYEGLDTKGQAKLTIKKDYRTIDGSYNATIVVKANGAAGKTMGFKVIDVDSTAKNLNVDKYNPYTYEMVAYSGATVTFTIRGTSKDYNWEDGKSYEINKFKVKAPSDSAITVKGFTLSMTGADKLDLRRYLEKAEVTVDGDTVSSTWEVNKDDQLVISFKKDVELAAKDNKEFVVSASFGDDFYNDYGKKLQLGILETSDFNAVDSKTSSRVTVGTDIKAASWPTYTFQGGKVKVTNTRLGNVDGAQAANDIVIAEGNITIPEDIKGTIEIEVKDSSADGVNTGAAYAIQAMRIIVAGDEYEANNATTNDVYKTAKFTFNNVEVEKSGKVQVEVDIRDTSAFSGKKLNFSFVKSFNTANNFVYVEGKKNIDVAGSMSISDLTIQAAKGSLTNSLTKDVEFRKNESNRKVVFDGTYTAKKGGVKLNEFTVSDNGTVNGTIAKSITFYLTVDGDEVADAKYDTTKKQATSTFTNVEIDSEKSVKVVLEAEVDANSTTGDIGKFYLNLVGEDENGNTAGDAKRTTTKLKIVEVGAIEVSTSTSKKDILRKSSNATLAEFTVKPANGASEVDLETIEFTLSGSKAAGGTFTADDVTLTIGGVTEDGTNPSAGKFSYSSTKTIGSDGIVVKVELNEEADGEVSLTNLKVNSKDQSSKQFVKAYYPAVVKVSKMEDLNGTTRYTVSVDKDSDIDVQNFTVYYSGTSFNGLSGDFANGDKFSIAGVKDVVSMITGVSYEYSNDAAGTCSDTSITDKTTCQSTPKTYHSWNAAVAATASAVASGITATDTDYYVRVASTGTGAYDDGAYHYNKDTSVTSGSVIADDDHYTLTATGSDASCTDGTSSETVCPTVPATYETWTASGYSKVSISKDALPDYFKIGSNEEDLKIFKL